MYAIWDVLNVFVFINDKENVLLLQFFSPKENYKKKIVSCVNYKQEKILIIIINVFETKFFLVKFELNQINR